MIRQVDWVAGLVRSSVVLPCLGELQYSDKIR